MSGGWDGLEWLAAVNLVVWTGLFVYLWRLDRKLADKEKR